MGFWNKQKAPVAPVTADATKAPSRVILTEDVAEEKAPQVVKVTAKDTGTNDTELVDSTGLKRTRTMFDDAKIRATIEESDKQYEKLAEEELRKAEEVSALFESTFLADIVDDFKTTTITDIRFNGTQLRVQCNVRGRYTPERQPTHGEVHNLIHRIALIQGYEFTDSEPILDTEIGEIRVSANHRVLSPSGATFALRISRPKLALQNFEDIAPSIVGQLLYVLVNAGVNPVIAGITGSGKTELQKYLVGAISDDQIIVLMEDTMDSHLKKLYPNKDISSWRTLTHDNRQRKVYYKHLMHAALRNNPEWAIISEMRDSDEPYHVLQVAISGHNVMTTLHTESAGAIPTRMVDMITETHPSDANMVGANVVRYLPLGVHLTTEFKDGKIERYITEVMEFTGFRQGQAEGNSMYKVSKQYDAVNKTYKKVAKLGKISEKMMERLIQAEVAHLLPDEFNPHIPPQVIGEGA